MTMATVIMTMMKMTKMMIMMVIMTMLELTPEQERLQEESRRISRTVETLQEKLRKVLECDVSVSSSDCLFSATRNEVL